MNNSILLSPHFSLQEFTKSATARSHGIRNEPAPENVENLEGTVRPHAGAAPDGAGLAHSHHQRVPLRATQPHTGQALQSEPAHARPGGGLLCRLERTDR